MDDERLKKGSNEVSLLTFAQTKVTEKRSRAHNSRLKPECGMTACGSRCKFLTGRSANPRIMNMIILDGALDAKSDPHSSSRCHLTPPRLPDAGAFSSSSLIKTCHVQFCKTLPDKFVNSNFLQQTISYS